jgi:hypothetical protein
VRVNVLIFKFNTLAGTNAELRRLETEVFDDHLGSGGVGSRGTLLRILRDGCVREKQVHGREKK